MDTGDQALSQKQIQMPLNIKEQSQEQLPQYASETNDNNPETEQTLQDLAKQGYRRSQIPKNPSQPAHEPNLPSLHCQALLATGLLAGGITALVLSYLKGSISLGLMICLSFITYAGYLLTALICNRLAIYLMSISRNQTFEQYFDKYKKERGHYLLQDEAYHQETTTTVVNGNTTSCTAKVVTGNFSQTVRVRTTDHTGSYRTKLKPSTFLIFVHFTVNARFADYSSNTNFTRIFENFKAKHRKRDQKHNYKYTFVLGELQKRKAFQVKDSCFDFFTLFVIFTALGLIWPFSMWFECVVSRFTVNFKKYVTL